MGKVLSRAETSKRAPAKAIRFPKTRYQRALDAARALPFEELIELVDTLRAETREERKAKYLARVDESVEDIKRGNCFEGTLEEAFRFLDE